MDILITSKTKKTPGPAVVIHCPACHADNVSAETLYQVEPVAAFYVIPYPNDVCDLLCLPERISGVRVIG